MQSTAEFKEVKKTLAESRTPTSLFNLQHMLQVSKNELSFLLLLQPLIKAILKASKLNKAQLSFPPQPLALAGTN